MLLVTSLVLRLSLGFMFIAAFLGKIGDRSADGFAKYTTNLDLSKLSNTSNYIEKQFADTILPGFVITPYATVLPWVELLCGVALVIGIVSRTAFVVTTLTLASLLFGKVLLGDLDTVIKIACYMGAAMAGIGVMHEVKASGKILGVDDFFGGKVTLE